jgi:hypothetical protein
MDTDYRVFTIRNSKIWVKLADTDKPQIDEKFEARRKKRELKQKEKEVPFPLPFKLYKTSKQPILVKDKDRLNEIYTIIYDSLVKTLQSKYLHANTKEFKLPDNCTLTAPRSEKAFVGEYPFGSSLSLEDSDAIIGISWNEEDNVADIDLSLLNMNNQKIGWNAAFKDSKSKILFSGDVVEPPGTELIYASNGFDFDSGVYVNLYRMMSRKADAQASFKFFVASEKIEEAKMKRNYMIDPNHVKFSAHVQMESKEMLIGFVTKGRFIFSTFRSNDSRVSASNVSNKKLIQFNLEVQKCRLDLRKLLVDVGLKETQIVWDENKPFTFETKSDLIGFFKI